MDSNLVQFVKINLDELKVVIHQLDNQSYCAPCADMNASIGQHVRHAIEIFMLLLQQYDDGHINYEKRARDKMLEQCTVKALEQIEFIKKNIEKPNKFLTLKAEGFSIPSTYFRELLYQVEHIIHHNAIIKPLLKKHIELHDSFGMAPSTIRNRS